MTRPELLLGASETNTRAMVRARLGLRVTADLIFHAVLVAGVWFCLLTFRSPEYVFFVGGVSCSFAYLGLAIREMRRSPLLLSPLSFYFLWYAVALGPSAIYLGIRVAGGSVLPFSVASVAPNELAVGYVVFLVGSLALHSGLKLLRPASDSAGSARRDLGEPLGGWLIFLWVVGILALLRPDAVAFLGVPGRTLRWAALASLAALALNSPDRLRLRPSMWLGLLILGTVGLFLASMMSYSKAYLMLALLPLLWGVFLRPRLRTWLPLASLGLALFYLFIVAPVVTAARYIPLREFETPATRLYRTARSLVLSGSMRFSASAAEEQVERFLYRQAVPVPVGYIVASVQKEGLRKGETLAYASYAFIPRLLWPDKPTVTRGAWFAAYVGAAESEERATMALGITATGELYWNFGLVGVCLGMLLIGMLLGLLWRMAGPDGRERPLHMLLYVTTMLSVINMSEFVTVVVFAISTLLLFGSLFLILHTAPRRSY